MTKKATKAPSKRVGKKESMMPLDNRFLKPTKSAPLLANNKIRSSKKRG